MKIEKFAQIPIYKYSVTFVNFNLYTQNSVKKYIGDPQLFTHVITEVICTCSPETWWNSDI